MKETHGSVHCAQLRLGSVQIPLFLGGNVSTTRSRLEIGYNMTETVVQINEQRHEEDTLVYTPQQITDHCEKIDNLCLSAHSDGKMLFEALQIIRQLQEAMNAQHLQEIMA